MKAALDRYRVLAYLTGVMLLLLTMHIIIQAVQAHDDHIAFSAAPGLGRWVHGADHWVPTIHGYVYLVYVVFATDLWFRFKTRLPAWKTALVVLAGVIPFMTFIAERWVTHQVRSMIAADSVAAEPVSSGQ